MLTKVRKYLLMEYEFAKNLKILRTEQGLSHKALAQKIGVSKGIISLWENNLREPKLSNLIALARFFDVSLDILVGLKDF